MDRYYIIVTPIDRQGYGSGNPIAIGSFITKEDAMESFKHDSLGFNPSENLFEIARVESKIVQRFQLLEAGESV